MSETPDSLGKYSCFCKNGEEVISRRGAGGTSPRVMPLAKRGAEQVKQSMNDPEREIMADRIPHGVLVAMADSTGARSFRNFGLELSVTTLKDWVRTSCNRLSELSKTA